MFKNIINQIKKSKLKILVVGDLMLDRFIYGKVERVSPEAPIPIVKLQKEKKMLGGCGNVINNLNNLGIETSLISVVGKDQAGIKILELLKKNNISVDNIIQLDNVRTTEKIRIVSGQQQVARADWDMEQINHPDLMFKNISNEIQNADAVIISDYAKGICSETFIKFVIKLCLQNYLPVYVDPKGLSWAKYKSATIITPNIKEAESIVGYKLENDKDFEIAGEKICTTYDLKGCLITRGGDGMSFFSKNEVFHLKSDAKEIFDVSGAGDTVISALAIGMTIKLEYAQAAYFANQAAGIVVGHAGTSAITIEELANLD